MVNKTWTCQLQMNDFSFNWEKCEFSKRIHWMALCLSILSRTFPLFFLSTILLTCFALFLPSNAHKLWWIALIIVDNVKKEKVCSSLHFLCIVAFTAVFSKCPPSNKLASLWANFFLFPFSFPFVHRLQQASFLVIWTIEYVCTLIYQSS